MTNRESTGTTLAQRERHALADLFNAVGPDAPTLCAGWSARDLAAHLVLREGHPAAVGIAIRPFASWTSHTQASLSHGDYGQLVERFRSGPPLLSAMRLPHADAAMNTFEHFVHHEDVRRASLDWLARELTPDDQQVLWQQLVKRARWYLRSSPVPLLLVAPDFGAIEIGHGRDDLVTLTAPPPELVLHIHGRRAHADVEVTGPGSARDKWEQHEQRG
ncbi:MAG: TIGR03085 family metal-binding protein [Actinomycetes bacterium]